MNGVLGTLPGMIGAMMHETLKVILELPCLRNELVLFGTLNWQFTVEVLVL
jgi:adenylyltransferase/sulfurtransferase